MLSIDVGVSISLVIVFIAGTFIEDEEILKLLGFYFSNMLFPLLKEHGIQLLSITQLVVKLVEPKDPSKNVLPCEYHLVDNVYHCLFRPVEFDAD